MANACVCAPTVPDKGKSTVEAAPEASAFLAGHSNAFTKAMMEAWFG